MTINEKIFNALNERGLKQSELAKYLDINQSVITTWKKRGSTPPAELLVRICEFTGLSIFELLDIESRNFDQELLKAYHAAAPGTQECVRKLLDIREPESNAALLNSKIG